MCFLTLFTASLGATEKGKNKLCVSVGKPRLLPSSYGTKENGEGEQMDGFSVCTVFLLVERGGPYHLYR